VLNGGVKVGNEVFKTSEMAEWHGKGFSRERWHFWSQRLGELATSELLSEDTKEAMRKAVVNMGKAERAKK